LLAQPQPQREWQGERTWEQSLVRCWEVALDLQDSPSARLPAPCWALWQALLLGVPSARPWAKLSTPRFFTTTTASTAAGASAFKPN